MGLFFQVEQWTEVDGNFEAMFLLMGSARDQRTDSTPFVNDGMKLSTTTRY